MRTKKVASILFILLISGICAIVRSQSSIVYTDKDNYIPGEWVIISGTGWQADDSVQLTLKHLDPLPLPYHSHDPWFVRPDADGRILFGWLVLEQESGTSFELGAQGFVRGIPSTDYAVTYFRDGAITSVTVTGSPFCAGQSISVSYTISNSGGQFGNNNVFTAQLSDSSGSFTAPVDIGSVRSRRAGTISAVIPPGTPMGMHYRIRVTSTVPVLNGGPNGSDLIIQALPAPPVMVTAIPNSICAGSSSSLNAISDSYTIRWYTSATGGSSLGTSASGANFPVSPSATTTYYAESLNASGCSSSSRTQVIVTVTPIPAITGTTPGSVCGSGQVTLRAASSAGIVNWYSALSGGPVLATGTAFTTPVITSTTTYYADATLNGCTTGTRTSITAAVNPAPVYSLDCSLGFGHAVLTVTSPVGTGLEYSLNAGAYQSSPIFAGIANGNYFLTVRNIQGCTALGNIFEVLCGCVNPPAVTMGAISGSTCGRTPVTVTGNTFSGSTTAVTITHDGTGSVNPASSMTTPFSFTYTPGDGDAGRTVAITVTSDNPLGPQCAIASGMYTLTVNSIPSAPVIGTLTSLTCSGGSGSVVLNGLPADGTWILARSPDNVTEAGSGTSTTVSGLPAGTFTFSVTNAQGCVSSASLNAVIQPQPPSPQPPATGTITHPTCAVSTGSVVLTGLPSAGSWTIAQNPGGVLRNGTGASITISLLTGGTYTFSVTNSVGCISRQSDNVVIHDQPVTPSAPIVTSVTPPSCTVATGSVNLTGLPSSGTWTLTRYPGTLAVMGTGAGTIITNLAAGTYNYTVANAAGCISLPTADVVIPLQPPTPDVPVIGTITQPTLTVQTGSVTLNRLPSSSWTITRLPDGSKSTGTGTSYTITGIRDGKYTFTVTNYSGCTSSATAEVIIATPVSPVIVITNPEPVCSPATVNLTLPVITAGSPAGLVYSYWKNSEATIPYTTPDRATDGTYYIKGLSSSGFYDIEPVTVTIEQIPVPNPGPDQVLDYKFSTTLNAVLDINETGIWRADSGNAVFSNVNDPYTNVSDLLEGKNVLEWIVSNRTCPSDTGKLTILVKGLTIPTLITPNGDSKNEYLVINGIENLGKTDLIIFDRRGREVFSNNDYDNKWNGLDNDGNPLPVDTYFYILKSANGKSRSGYVMIRR